MAPVELSLADQIDIELKQAMRDQDSVAKLTLRSIKAAITAARKVDNADKLADEDVVALIQIEAKRRRDAAGEYEKAGSPERAQQERAELAILERYLPQQLTEAELDVIAADVIAEIGATSMRDMGKIMSHMMPRVAGRADGKLVNSVVRRLLTS